MANEAEPLDLSVQIINYDTKPDLVCCLHDLEKDLEGSDLKWQAFILQNGQINNLSDIEEQYTGNQNFKFVELPENLGFAKGHNYLAGLQRSKHLLILNPDIIFLEEDTVKGLLDSLIITGAGIIGPTLKTQSGNFQAWDHGEFFLGSPALSFYRRLTTLNQVGWVSGACMLMPRCVFDDLGGFDEGFFLYQEDDDICYRAAKEGYQVFYNPLIQLQHNTKSQTHKGEYMRRSVDYFLNKHRSDIGPLAYWGKKVVNNIIPY